MSDAKLEDETARLASLHRYQVLDSGREAPFDKITALVRTVLGVRFSAVSFIDDQRQWFKAIAGIDMEETPRCVAFCDHTIRQREPLLVEDARNDPRFSDSPLVTGEPHVISYLGIPLCTPDGYNLGSLCAIGNEPRQFSAQDVRLLESFAALVLDELELRTRAHRDHLTGIPLRRPWLDEAGKAFDRFLRSSTRFSIAVFDIDNFKRVNDTWGHARGDDVLRAVSQTGLAQLRPTDQLCRLGGEEFAVLLPEIDQAGAIAVAERLRTAIASLPPFPGGPDKVTASFGIATAHTGTRSVEALLAEADAALYLAKRGGRNRCIGTAELERAAA